MKDTLQGVKTKYRVLEDGKWYSAPSVFACCDCCLVHNVEYRWVNGELEWKLVRNKRRTAALRRPRKKA
jgi:hypothetical protein